MRVGESFKGEGVWQECTGKCRTVHAYNMFMKQVNKMSDGCRFAALKEITETQGCQIPV